MTLGYDGAGGTPPAAPVPWHTSRRNGAAHLSLMGLKAPARTYERTPAFPTGGEARGIRFS